MNFTSLTKNSKTALKTRRTFTFTNRKSINEVAKDIATDVASLHPELTPKLTIHLSKIENAYKNLEQLLPDVAIHYAMKCNPNSEILKYVDELGGGFEIASAHELDQLIGLGIDTQGVLYSNPVKHSEHIAYAYNKGVRTFAFDSKDEAEKLAKHAPGSLVFVRLAAPMSNSVVESEGKFGVSVEDAEKLLHFAKTRGLIPYGIAFHVGSQMLEPNAWRHAIRACGKIMDNLSKSNIKLQMLNIGGGFPVKYENTTDLGLKKICTTIDQAITEFIPYKVKVVSEPGRYLVAEAGIMEATVIGVAQRFEKKWVHLNIGAMNGFLEALETRNELQFPTTDSRNSKDKDVFVLTGPTCDSQDSIMNEVALSADIREGDKVYISYAGAYTTAYTKNFNGFPDPTEEII